MTKLASILIITFSTLLMSFNDETAAVNIDWKEQLKGDFSFRKKWSYPSNVFTNKYGQLVCDGLCDDTLDTMCDKNGRIKKKFLKTYYSILDTTHYYHTMQCDDTWCYEYGGTDFMEVFRKGKDTVRCESLANVGTHSSLKLTIVDGKCYPTIFYHSIRKTKTDNGVHTFVCTDGDIQIDKNLWKKGILKATFAFNFKNHIHPNYEIPMHWNGKIYAKIENIRKGYTFWY